MEGVRAVPELRGIIPNSFAHIFGHIAKAEGDTRYWGGALWSGPPLRALYWSFAQVYWYTLYILSCSSLSLAQLRAKLGAESESYHISSITFCQGQTGPQARELIRLQILFYLEIFLSCYIEMYYIYYVLFLGFWQKISYSQYISWLLALQVLGSSFLPGNIQWRSSRLTGKGPDAEVRGEITLTSFYHLEVGRHQPKMSCFLTFAVEILLLVFKVKLEFWRYS